MQVRAFDDSKIEKPNGFDSFAWPKRFWTSAPVDLEIGCGVGWHPIQYVKANPDRNLVAIEHTREKFERFRGRIANNGHPENLLAVHADAVRWLVHAMKAKERKFSRIFLLYPNPEPNAPNKRWFRSPFFNFLISTLETNGTITLATNIESYANEAENYGVNGWNLELVERSIVSSGATPRSHFERKYLLRGETCHDLVFKKGKK